MHTSSIAISDGSVSFNDEDSKANSGWKLQLVKSKQEVADPVLTLEYQSYNVRFLRDQIMRQGLIFMPIGQYIQAKEDAGTML